VAAGSRAVAPRAGWADVDYDITCCVPATCLLYGYYVLTYHLYLYLYLHFH